MSIQGSVPSFLELTLQGNEPAWCVDGRPDNTKAKGAQMLGGSLHPILLAAISVGADFDEVFVKEKLGALKDAGLTTGAHRGSHKNAQQNSSGCGFADGMPQIFQTAVSQKEKIIGGLLAVYEKYKETIGQLDIPFSDILDTAYAKLDTYSSDKIRLTGERLLHMLEENGAVIEDVEGEHGELAAFVNVKNGTTFDTNGINRQGQQAFNIDLWSAVSQSEKLGVDSKFALGASLILYVATEIVLVEDKGKPALEVVVR